VYEYLIKGVYKLNRTVDTTISMSSCYIELEYRCLNVGEMISLYILIHLHVFRMRYVDDVWLRYSEHMSYTSSY